MTTIAITTDNSGLTTSVAEEIDRLRRLLSASDIRLAAMGDKNMETYATRKALADEAAV